MSTETEPLIENAERGYGAARRENLEIFDPGAGPSTGAANEPQRSQPNPTIKYGKAAKWPQYSAALSSTLGAFALGTVLGWIGPAVVELNSTYGLTVGYVELSWLGSLIFLGAACVLGPIEYFLDRFGRKYTMLLLMIPFTIGWICIIFASKLYMIYIGRFVTGFASGGFCVTTPIYIAEIAQKEIRGSLATMFPLMITLGILFAYVIGSITTIISLSVICATIPLIFGIIFCFQPESPIYLVRKNQMDEARAALLQLRGRNYDIDSEIREIVAAEEELNQNPSSFWQTLKKRSTQQALLMSCGTMALQQLTGLYSILAYSTVILQGLSAKLPFEVIIIFLGVIQVLGSFISEAVVDTRGRKYLLTKSAIYMAISLLILGLYFQFQYVYPFLLYTNNAIIPLFIISAYAICYSFGFGPVPWVLTGEVYPPAIKDRGASIALLVNLLGSFIVAQYFMPLIYYIGRAGTFYLFAGICALSAVFVQWAVIETKGKSLTEIQHELERS